MSLCLLKVMPVFLWISLGRWQKWGNSILTLIGLPFCLNNRKNIQLSHWQLQSAHFTAGIENRPAAENQPQTRGAHMQAIIYLETGWPAVAPSGSEAGWLLASRPGHPGGCLPLAAAAPIPAHLRLQAEQKAGEKVSHWQWVIPNQRPELYPCTHAGLIRSRDKSVHSTREGTRSNVVTNMSLSTQASYKAHNLHSIHTCRKILWKGNK